MDIDLAALRAIERDKDISMDYLIKTLEDALLNAYQKTDNPLRGVKVEIDRKTGRVAVLAPEFDDDDNVIGYYDDTPDDFGRVAASTARQVIFQRIREAEDDQKYGHFSGTEGDILTGVIQADRDSRAVRVDLGSLEAIMPLAEQVPGEDYSHGKRLKVYVVSVRRSSGGRRSWSRAPIRTWCANCSPWRSRRSRRAWLRSRRWHARRDTVPRSR